MKGNCLTVSVRRRKTVLMDGTELSQEMMWGGENLKRATEAGDFIESLVKEMKVLADEIDSFLEVSPDIIMICCPAKNYLFYCQKNSNGFTS